MVADLSYRTTSRRKVLNHEFVRSLIHLRLYRLNLRPS